MYPILMTQISLFIVSLSNFDKVSGGYFVYNFDNGLLGGDLQCNTSATLSCIFAVNSSIIRWTIAPKIETVTPYVAHCGSSSCSFSSNYSPPAYIFTYDKSTGVTNVTIKTVTFEHASLEFRCDNGSKPKPFKPSVTVPPERQLTEVTNTTTASYIELGIKTSCIYPADKVNITWYSKPINGTKRNTEIESQRTVTSCRVSSECIAANKSSQIISILHIPRNKDGKRRKRRSTDSVQEIAIEVQVQHPSGSFLIGVGHYSITVTQGGVDETNDGLSKEKLAGVIISSILGFFSLVAAVVYVVHRCARCTYTMCSVADAPPTPTDFQQVPGSGKEHSATFTCIPGPYPPGQQTIVLCCRHNSGQDEHNPKVLLVINNAGGSVVELTINDLWNWCLYDCFVYSMSNNGRSGDSKIIPVTPGLPPDKPVNFQIIKVGADIIYVSWNPGHYRRNKHSFILLLMDTNGDWTREEVNMKRNENTIEHSIEPVRARTTYFLWLSAKNEVGESESIGPVEITTLGSPDPPTKLKRTLITSSSITITWRPGSYRRDKQIFIVEYGRAKKNPDHIKREKYTKADDGKPVMSYEIKNLKSGTKYVIVISAQNDTGVCKRSLTLRLKTKEETTDDQVMTSEAVG